MKNGNLPIPKLCHQIWKLYCELDGKGEYFAKEELEKQNKKISDGQEKLFNLLYDRYDDITASSPYDENGFLPLILDEEGARRLADYVRECEKHPERMKPIKTVDVDKEIRRGKRLLKKKYGRKVKK